MRSYPVELSVREAQLVVSGLTTLLRELEQRESGLVELRDSDDVSLAAAAAPDRLDQLGAIQAEVALLQERLIDASIAGRSATASNAVSAVSASSAGSASVAG